MMSIRLAVLVLLGGCASVPTADDRLDVDASRTVESPEVSVFRVTVMNTSDDPITIERVEVQPAGGPRGSRAFVSARQTIPPGGVATFNMSSHTDARDLRRTAEEIGGQHVMTTSGGSLVQPTARVYVTFSNGSKRTASFKVDL